MVSFDTLLTFVGAATLLAWVPGPDNLFVLTQSAFFGRAVGMYVTLGLCAGLIVHTIAVSLGVAAIFQTSQTAFDALKIIGAVYLLYLAYKAFTSEPDEPESRRERAKPAWQMFVRGVVMNVTNPKVAIFFLAFLPQFTTPERGSVVLQMLTLGGVFIVCAFASFALISVLSGSLSRWLQRSSQSRLWLNRAAGMVFVGLAVKIATSHR
uniref:LysE family translocator n=1 Tax=Neorhizobium sp. EC2-8 TaxID=3129230 RepID=UPI003100E1BC